MLSAFYSSAARIRELRDQQGPFGPLLERFAGYLQRSGYSSISARRHLRSAEHVVHWAIGANVSPEALDAVALARFGKHLSRCRCRRFGCAARADVLAGARLLLEQFGGTQRAGIRETHSVAAKPALLKSFEQWMREQRGSSEGTLYNYSLPIRALIERYGEDPGQFDARRVREFVVEYSQGRGWAATQHCTTALRMLLHFLVADSRCRGGLFWAVPTMAHWWLSLVPRCLPPADVERLIASCDSSTTVGIRDRAILLLLARLGLRASDIVRLRMADIDWKEAWIRVCGKGHQEARLPLSQEVGDALVGYLQQRPAVDTDALFLRTRAPWRALGSHCAVSVLVDRAIRRAGVECPARGAAHLLRHSVASSMLRQGASLQDIAALLRHRSVETTQIYAKVDVRSLMQIAQPWVEAWPC